MQATIAYLSYEETRTPKHIIEILKKDPERLSELELSELPIAARRHIETYQDAALGLEFGLQMTEDNAIGGGTSLLRPFTGGLDLIGFNAGMPRQRKNFRYFKIIEDWSDLVVLKKNKDNCKDWKLIPQNFNYPISGRIGISEIVDTYIRLNDKVTFAKPRTLTDAAFVDDLLFTTTLTASINPSFDLTSPNGRGYLIRSASGNFGATRVDQHQLVVALYIPPKDDKDEGQPVAKNKVVAKTRPRPAATLTLSPSALSPKDVVARALDRASSRRFNFGVDPFLTLQELQR